MKPTTGLTSRSSRASGSSRLTAREEGFALTLTLIMFTLLMGFAGLSVDLGNWYLHIERAQHAADAAALDGAVMLPAEPLKAVQVAKESLARNHVPQEFIDSAEIHQVGGKPNALFVQVSTEVSNTFLPLLGVDRNMTFTRSAIATWLPGLGAGSFSNVLGNEPPDASGTTWQDPVKSAAQGQFWLNIGGGSSSKVRGDRFGTKYCSNTSSTSDISGCDGPLNKDYKHASDGPYSAGYEYVVDVAKGAAGNVVGLQIYDPEFAMVHDTCDADELKDFYEASGNNPRYAPGPGDYCTGDENYEDLSSAPQPTTYVQVLDFATHQPIPSCPSEQSFRPYGAKSGALTDYQTDPEFLRVFRQWVDLCSAPYDPVSGSKYIIRVRTDDGSDGFNRFSLRAGLFSGSAGPTVNGALIPTESYNAVRISGTTSLPLWANFNGADTRFAVTFVPPGYAGQEVEFQLFDIGDADEPGTLTLISSSTTADGSATTQDCKYTPPHQDDFQPLPNCELGGIIDEAGFDGQQINMKWRVPDDYTCDPSGATPTATCYLFVRLAYPSGAGVNDATTWTISGSSSPLHIIK